MLKLKNLFVLSGVLSLLMVGSSYAGMTGMKAAAGNNTAQQKMSGSSTSSKLPGTGGATKSGAGKCTGAVACSSVTIPVNCSGACKWVESNH